MRSVARIFGAGLQWAIVYGVVWAVAWFSFMRAEWYGALAIDSRTMPWTEIWTIWAALNLPLGVATAAHLRSRTARTAPASALVGVVLVLWVPMTLGMTAWAWYESLSLALIVVDSTVNLAGLALASLLARAAVRTPIAADAAGRESGTAAS